MIKIRKLATIQKILDLQKIENSDNLEVATILGWKCVVQKNQFKIGDLVVYFEIDSLLPERPEFEFLRKSCFVENKLNKGFRIKTMKLRGQISQGLVMPLSILNCTKYKTNTKLTPEYTFTENQDVTELLNVKKYEIEISTHLAGSIKGDFPSFIPKTDETRVQILQKLLDKYKDTACFITEKIDGSSVTIYYNNGQFGVCSRNFELQEQENNAIWQLVKQWNIKEKLIKLNKNIAIQGEIFGIGINRNRLKQQKVDILFFNIFDIDKQEYLNFYEFLTLLDELSLRHVPLIQHNYKLTNNIDELIKLASRKSMINEECEAEGIVIRPMYEIYDNNFSEELTKNRISFKVINPNYLLKHDE